MRHEDINTTLKYYTWADTDADADVLWGAVEKLPAINKLVNKATRKQLGN
jgi:hypothetical protein